jgi:hypothetical protein
MRLLQMFVISIMQVAAISPMFSQSSARGMKNVFWQPNELQQGSPVFITVELERVPLRVTGKWRAALWPRQRDRR